MINKWQLLNLNFNNREIISSEKKENFCLECGWKQQVEKIEITPETIRSFMEKKYFAYFKFGKDGSGNIINIGVNKEKILTFAPRVGKSSIDYYPKIQEDNYWEKNCLRVEKEI